MLTTKLTAHYTFTGKHVSVFAGYIRLLFEILHPVDSVPLRQWLFFCSLKNDVVCELSVDKNLENLEFRFRFEILTTVKMFVLVLSRINGVSVFFQTLMPSSPRESPPGTTSPTSTTSSVTGWRYQLALWLEVKFSRTSRCDVATLLRVLNVPGSSVSFETGYMEALVLFGVSHSTHRQGL
jgi:hypothetical protein